jgi:hypothetical protein
MLITSQYNTATSIIVLNFRAELKINDTKDSFYDELESEF